MGRRGQDDGERNVMAIDVITDGGSPMRAPGTRRFLGKTGEFSLEVVGEMVGQGISAFAEAVLDSLLG
ncbi:hypothetical protein [Actinospica robiniae]|uniref:hypothetical protein n=1 Tax=Actinospica robiniae TaxID=304901 RepID=UPI00054DA5F2|nr:hypothetical protein [Actinospica robiniae]